MFFVFGENNKSGGAVGKGETVMEAIQNWSSAGPAGECFQEFAEWQPVIVEGEEREVEILVKVKQP